MRHGPGPRLVAACALALAALAASSASAHLMRTGHGTINVVGEKAYVVLNLPVTVFQHSHAAAAVADGVLTHVELEANKATLRAAIRAGVRLEARGVDATLPTIMLSLPTGEGHEVDRGPELIVMIVAQLGSAPESLTFESTLWANEDTALLIRATESAGRETLRAEIGEVTLSQPAYIFFATPAQTVVGFLRRGLVHFAGGPDHFIFVLMVLIAALDRRRRIAWALAFVAGCGAGLAAAAAEWTPASPAWIEVVIALSVVALAALALTGRRLPSTLGAALVFGGAVFHGFGFASISRFGEHLPEVKVASFGLGVALGVGLLAALWAAVCLVIERRLGAEVVRRVSGVLAIVGCVIGLLWVAERVGVAWSAPPPPMDTPR